MLCPTINLDLVVEYDHTLRSHSRPAPGAILKGSLVSAGGCEPLVLLNDSCILTESLRVIQRDTLMLLCFALATLLRTCSGMTLA